MNKKLQVMNCTLNTKDVEATDSSDNVQATNENKIPTDRNISVMDAICELVKMSKDSDLSDEFFDQAKPYLNKISTMYSITPVQATFLAVIIECSSDDEGASLHDIQRFLKLGRAETLKFSDELDELLKRGFIILKNSFRDEKAYAISCEVLNAFKKDKTIIPNVIKSSSYEDVFHEFALLCDKMKHGRHTMSSDEFLSKIKVLMGNHIGLPICKKISKTLLKLNKADALIFICLCNKLICAHEDEISFSDLEDFFSNEWESFQTFNNLINKKSSLLTKKIMAIPNRDEIHFGRRGIEMQFTDMAKKKYFNMNIPERRQEAEDDRLENNRSESVSNLLAPADFVEKELFYNEEEAKQIEKLTKLLLPDNFVDVQKRMRNKKMREGFACLFYGAPGTGKTETVYQLARECGRKVMKVDLGQCKSKYYGESERIVKSIFETYQKYLKSEEVAPILLLNEADGLLSKRRTDISQTCDQIENTLQNILLEGFENFEGILIATTNMVDNFDEAFERRFIFKIEFCKPNELARRNIWLSLFPALDEKGADRLAKEFAMTGGQIENVTRKFNIDDVLMISAVRVISQIYCMIIVNQNVKLYNVGIYHTRWEALDAK